MKRKRGNPISGWVILDKPEGLSSTQSMAKVRGLLQAQKAGHGGTLDPFATGVLPIALGEATKLLSYVLDGDKVYWFRAAWGDARDTDDMTGQSIARSDVRPTPAAIEAALPRFLGAIEQVPPRFSAIHVDGQRAYDLARDGQEVELKPRRVYIHRITYLGSPSADEADFEVACGKGTYIRSLARDMGEILGTKAHVKALKRLASGPFRLEHAISLENIAKIMHKDAAPDAFRGVVLPLNAALDDIPAIAINEQETRKLRQGQPIVVHPLRVPQSPQQGPYAAQDKSGLVALVRADMNSLVPLRVFNLQDEGVPDVAKCC